MMYDISEETDFLKLCWGIVSFSLFFLASAVLVAVFLPVRPPDDSTELQKISRNFVFPDDLDTETDSFVLSPELASDFSGMDKGLELYREPSSRAAVEWFYLNITGKRDVTYAILYEANRNNIPLSLAFALAYTESHYRTDAINRNTNSSVDRGLFQLNNLSFPALTEADFFNPAVSAKYGMSHLRFCLDTAGNEITALAMYNAGTVRVRRNSTPRSTLQYVDAIMRYRTKLEAAFSDEIVALYDIHSDSDSRLALAK